MSTQNKLKIVIGTVTVLLIAFYTYCLFVYGDKYLSGTEYINHAGMTVLFTIPAIASAKLLSSRKKWAALLLIGIISVSGVLAVSANSDKSLKYNAEMLIISLWPLLCYAIAKHINPGKIFGIKPFILDSVSYNIVIAGLIWLLEEVIFKYKYISADVIAEMYMYVISVAAFLLYNIKVKRIKPDKRDILCFAVIVGIIAAFWICNQERIAAIIESISYGRTSVDADGEFTNWISHRLSMLQASLNGDFSGINIHHIQPMMKGCSLAWLSGVGGWYITAIIFVLSMIMACLMAIYARKTGNVPIKIVTMSFILKIIIGLIANAFLIFSTTIGVPFIKTSYDIILCAAVVFCSAIKTDGKSLPF